MNHEELNAIQLAFYGKYGQQIGETEAYLLHEIRACMQERKAPQEIRFESASQSLYYSLGRFLPMALACVFLGGMALFAWMSQQEQPLATHRQDYQLFAEGASPKEYKGVVYVKMKLNHLKGGVWSKDFVIGQDAFIANKDSVIIPIYTKVEK